MAPAATTKISLNVNALLSNALDLSTVRDQLTKDYVIDLPNGSGTGQADQIFHDQRTVTTGATDSLDLAGVLTNALGVTVTFTVIKAIILKAAVANTTILSVTRPAANGAPIFAAASDATPIGPGGLFVWCSPAAGIAVTPATGDLLDIVNAAGASAVYDIIIIGV